MYMWLHLLCEAIAEALLPFSHTVSPSDLFLFSNKKKSKLEQVIGFIIMSYIIGMLLL